MTREPAAAQPWTVALAGLLALAVAMGIGRFAFTPILPMMQQDSGITVAEGGWLASANYAGYLAGALVAMRMPWHAGTAVRVGLLAIGVTTLAMAFDAGFAAWLVLRFAAGVASAWVLVNVSALATQQLAAMGRPGLSAVVFAGVGLGIVFAGLACLALLAADARSRHAWLLLGVSALAGTALAWRATPSGRQDRGAAPGRGREGGAVPGTRPAAGDTEPLLAAATPPRLAASTPPRGWRTFAPYSRYILCYCAFGIGYIIPATFLPVMARAAMPDPALFGWAWPAFGAAGALSTLVAARLARAVGQRQVWAAANFVMAIGVLAPVALPGLGGIVLAAVCVGSTFMVVTMLGLQEARRLAGPDARMLMAAMTASFALGQIVGPLLVGGLVRFAAGFSYALAIAAAVLLAAAVALAMGGNAAAPRVIQCPTRHEQEP